MGVVLRGGDNMITERQKEMIRILRNLGHGYKRIAKEMNLKLHTVRDYCRYHHLTGNARLQVNKMIKHNQNSNLVSKYCQYCGRRIKQNTFQGRRKKFCSDKCRYAYWNCKTGRGHQ